jgi:hypothetical protein
VDAFVFYKSIVFCFCILQKIFFPLEYTKKYLLSNNLTPAWALEVEQMMMMTTTTTTTTSTTTAAITNDDVHFCTVATMKPLLPPDDVAISGLLAYYIS